MFDRVTLSVRDREASRGFYDTVLAPLAHRRTSAGGGELDEWGAFAIGRATSERPPTRHLHLAFTARSRAEVDAFWGAGIAAGAPSAGEPGLRVAYHGDYYGAFLRDPDGNSAEAVFHGRCREGDCVIDHLWIGVSHVAASRRFYTAVAPELGASVRDRAGRFHVGARDRSFALVGGRPASAHVHLAFAVPTDTSVDAFHRTALQAGGGEIGPPDERGGRPRCYAGRVLDPDGNVIEVVSRTDRASGSPTPRR